MAEEWGPITWTFLHSMVEKINPNLFNDYRNDYLDIIYGICTNLPCPDCSDHARMVLHEAYYNKIENKEDLIEFLIQFHNIVNKRLNKPKFDEIDNLYKNKNLVMLFNDMINIHSKFKSTNQKLMAHNFQRNLYMRKLYEQFNHISKTFLI